MSKIITERIKVKNIDHDMRSEMFSLFDRYYTNTDYNRFCKDLDEKDHVLIMWNKTVNKNELIGFTTVMRKTCHYPEAHVYIFSGDTVIDKKYWGSKYLQKSFFWYILETKILAINKPVYWFLISKGHKTYLMMRNNFPHSFPNRNQFVPNKMKAIMDHYYKHRYHNAYCEKTNLIRFDECLEATKSQYWDIKSDFQQDPDGAYFLSKNPDFSKGVELACIAEVRWTEFYQHFKKFFAKGLLIKLISPAIKDVKPQPSIKSESLNNAPTIKHGMEL